jgi:hypothetical protein
MAMVNGGGGWWDTYGYGGNDHIHLSKYWMERSTDGKLQVIL